jgi:hypothetical protein
LLSVLLSTVFNNSIEVLEQYRKVVGEARRFMLRNTKMSEFAENVFLLSRAFRVATWRLCVPYGSFLTWRNT